MKKILDNKIKRSSIVNDVIDELHKEWKIFNLTNVKRHLLNQDELETYWVNKIHFNDKDFFDQLNRSIHSNVVSHNLSFLPLIKRETFIVLTDYICANYIESCKTAVELVATVPAFKQCIYDTYIIRANYANNVDFAKELDEKLIEKTIRKSLLYMIKDHLGIYNISMNYKEKIDMIIDMIVSLNLNRKTYEEYINSIKHKFSNQVVTNLLDVTKTIYNFPTSIFEAFSLNIPKQTFRGLFIKNPVLEYLMGPSILCDQNIKYSMIISKIISKTGIGIHDAIIRKFIDSKTEETIFAITYENVKKYYMR